MAPHFSHAQIIVNTLSDASSGNHYSLAGSSVHETVSYIGTLSFNVASSDIWYVTMPSGGSTNCNNSGCYLVLVDSGGNYINTIASFDTSGCGYGTCSAGLINVGGTETSTNVSAVSGDQIWFWIRGQQSGSFSTPVNLLSLNADSGGGCSGMGATVNANIAVVYGSGTSPECWANSSPYPFAIEMYVNSTALPGPTVSFQFPVNGTTTSDFSTWYVNVSNMSTTVRYLTNVQYSLVSSSLQYADSFGGVLTGTTYANLHWLKGQSLASPYSATSTWNATAYVTLADCTTNCVVASTSIQFTVNNNAPILQNNTTSLIYNLASSSVPTNNATDTNSCSNWTTPGSGIFDIGNGLLYAGCRLIVFTLVPGSNFTNALSASIQGFQGIFPFNLYFAVVGGVRDDLFLDASSTPTTTLTLSTQGLYGEQLNLINVSSTFLASALSTPTTTGAFGGTIHGCDINCSTEKISNAYLPIKIAVWIIAGLKIVGMITAL